MLDLRAWGIVPESVRKKAGIGLPLIIKRFAGRAESSGGAKALGDSRAVERRESVARRSARGPSRAARERFTTLGPLRALFGLAASVHPCACRRRSKPLRVRKQNTLIESASGGDQRLLACCVDTCARTGSRVSIPPRVRVSMCGGCAALGKPKFSDLSLGETTR